MKIFTLKQRLLSILTGMAGLFLATSSLAGETIQLLPQMEIPASSTEIAFPLILRKIPVRDLWLFTNEDIASYSCQLLSKELFGKPESLPGRLLANRLTDATKVMLESFYLRTLAGNESRTAPPLSPALVENLKMEVNAIVSGELFYDEKAFVGIKLGSDSNELLRTHKKEESNPRLNRILLEDAFPRIFRKLERVLADPGSPFIAHLDYVKATIQFYDESGKKLLFVDLAAKYKAEERFYNNIPRLNSEYFSGNSFFVSASKSSYEIKVREALISFGTSF